MSTPPQGAQLSEDGYWWWDGVAWQPTDKVPNSGDANIVAGQQVAAGEQVQGPRPPGKVTKTPLSIRSMKLVGGSPDIKPGSSVHLWIVGDILEIRAGFRKVQLPLRHVTARAESQQEFQRRVTATRLLSVGIFALAAKKKTVTLHQYLTLSFDDGDHQQELVIETDKAPKAAQTIQTHSAMHRTQAAAATALPAQDSTPTAAAPDIPEMLRKLAELHESGVLTREEFESKKAELLARL